MKKISIFVTAFFVIMAAALGWFLPLATFNLDDRLTEGKQMQLDIERVNLSYRDDLSIAQKINIVNYEDNYEKIEIDRGIYFQEEEIRQIIIDFLVEFTGYKFDSLEKVIRPRPFLYNSPSNKGTVVLWEVTECVLENGWLFTCHVDDKTGSILNCFFICSYGDWSTLISDYYSLGDPYAGICERYRNAIYNHYSKTIDAKFINYYRSNEFHFGEEDEQDFKLIFKDDKNDTFDITFSISLDFYYFGAN